ncbi:MAG: tripartite tricarboxylate transporter substrate binding protein [Rhodocyclaceae bacterium]|nr:tripartite tricarboxylate transporter substrate binding protein [Rhodocyclaceae bacterium]MCA3074407.1 tripartite tricarboxylate transporter substrate binding protein [Rhodocyclaceae bacterium]MCA3090814.1 tripartite tricarboxylate transporter substrate binding protein [Rhodocyclaceae bacterium]MCA3095507.1 tripartite tricarboxylate transporter substrate binding protein [Rhodocyclaceae bacterium]MCA3097514.1 tripartite tricarboxylate transporter substrate binding protein [Rhodocyclaceae bact
MARNSPASSFIGRGPSASSCRIAAACALGVIAACAHATVQAQPQDYPSRPVRSVVPFAAGGLNDTLSRLFAQALSERLKATFVIDNRPGAGGTTGTAIVAQAVADGYTLLFSSSTTIAVSPHLFTKLAYDPVRDFAPITSLATVESVLLVNPATPAKTVKEVVALARAQPGQIRYGSVGIGSSQHIAGALFGTLARVELLHVPYKAAGQVLADLLNGSIALDFEPMPTALPHIRAGRLRPVAVTSTKRSQVLPEVPTIAESLPGYEMSLWTGLLAPRGTPRPIVDRLNGAIAEVLTSADMKERLLGLGAAPLGDTPERFAAFIRREVERMGEVVKASGATAQ